MALIIKGDMPTFCERLNKNGDMEYCRFACVCESHNISTMAIPSDCPILGEIPDEHEALIDRHELVRIVECWSACHTALDFSFSDFIKLIYDAPVVVEASKCQKK